MGRIKRWFGKLFIHNYVGVEYRTVYLLALVGILWGVFSLSLNFDKPINLAQFRDHSVLLSWIFLPTKISAYMTAFFFDMFQFIFWKTIRIQVVGQFTINDIIGIFMLVFFSIVIGARIVTYAGKKLGVR